jgi:thiopurine S-methyltransferase
MDASFWRRRWERNEIAFHQREANPLLVRHLHDLALPEGSRVFVPLCGKSLDIHWLLGRGYRIAGSELSKIAIQQLFSELGVEPGITADDEISRYSADSIDIFVGDFFHLSSAMLGQIDAVYDRAALVALPETMRDRYTAHLMEITDQAPQLLITFNYDQRLLDGPPFSVSDEEVGQRYQDSYNLKLLESADVPGGLKGKCPANENAWLLKKRPGVAR